MTLRSPEEWAELLCSNKESTQMAAMRELRQASPDQANPVVILKPFLQGRSAVAGLASLLDGMAIQMLTAAQTRDEASGAAELLRQFYPEGILQGHPDRGILLPLQELLAQQSYQHADALTTQILCRVAGEGAVDRAWLYFTEVRTIPKTVLAGIDQLWWLFSEGKFSYRVQRQIWLSGGKSWERLWAQIGWKKSGSFTRYPGGFTWDLTAPRGHLPLTNQLRGNKVLLELFSHPLWQD
ncbi:MAG: GUN4 domain-containing protein [Oscillatoriales cyanobacterium SM2_2_1]|nr:GUN4 domain-containing protein [Oscillatoriales cyanobacterium SM2_2_1]